jgi:hypothetical protein
MGDVGWRNTDGCESLPYLKVGVSMSMFKNFSDIKLSKQAPCD